LDIVVHSLANAPEVKKPLLEIPPAARLEQRLLHLWGIGEAVHHDVEGLGPEVLTHPLRHPLHAEVAPLATALVTPDIGRRIGKRVERRVERVDALEGELPAPRHLERRVDLAALEQLGEDAERRRPAADADGSARLGERLGDRETEATVVRDAGHERPLPRQIDLEHGLPPTSEWPRFPR